MEFQECSDTVRRAMNVTKAHTHEKPLSLCDVRNADGNLDGSVPAGQRLPVVAFEPPTLRTNVVPCFLNESPFLKNQHTSGEEKPLRGWQTSAWASVACDRLPDMLL